MYFNIIGRNTRGSYWILLLYIKQIIDLPSGLFSLFILINKYLLPIGIKVKQVNNNLQKK
jgi:hypothetical protein